MFYVILKMRQVVRKIWVGDMIKKFDKNELLEIDLPYLDEGQKVDDVTLISREIIDTNRWSIIYEIVFRFDDQLSDQAWSASYSVGATEMQDESPWEYEEEVKAILVKRVEKVVEVWEPA